MKIAKGETRPSRVNRLEPVMPEAPEGCPELLKGEAARAWARLAPILREAGVLRVTDVDILVTYCRTVADLRRFERLASRNAEAALMRGYQGQVNKLRQAQRQLGAELGLSPSSRSGVKAERPASGDARDMKRFFGVIAGGKR